MTKPLDLAARLPAAAHRRDVRTVSRTISALERGELAGTDLVQPQAALSTGCHVVGLTGAPGVGKSTMLAELVGAWRSRGRRVAVLAIDPSSSSTGGAVLGDRARMGELALDEDVFIRSMATRGHLGGLARAVPASVHALMVAGYDVVALETVGVGQSEIDVAAFADTTCVLLAPGMGDSLQAVKAGVMEVADVFVVTKADLPAAHEVARDLRGAMLGTGRATADAWVPRIVQTSARDGEGFETLADALDEHHRFVVEHDVRATKARRRVRDQLLAEAAHVVRSSLLQDDAAGLSDAVDAVLAGRADLNDAVGVLLSRWPGTGAPRADSGADSDA